MTDDVELARCRGVLGVGSGASEGVVKKAYMQRSFAMISRNAGETERESLKLARDTLLAESHEAERRSAAERRASAVVQRGEVETKRLVAMTDKEEREARERIDPRRDKWDPRSFDSAAVNLLAPPLVAGLGILAAASPLSFLLSGFFVWIHEFGHSTVAWMTGHRALPLPIGWSNVDPEQSKFVYFGILFLFGILFATGAKERKVAPMLCAVVLAIAQYVMTWAWSRDTGYKWSVFAGIGGEFYLPAAAIALFYFRMPEKFRWGGCRYVFLVIGSASFYHIYTFWRDVKYGRAPLPYGTMVGGEEDAGGDLNILNEDYGWRDRDIIRIYDQLGHACLIAMLVVYVFFALRGDKVVARMFGKREPS